MLASVSLDGEHRSALRDRGIETLQELREAGARGELDAVGLKKLKQRRLEQELDKVLAESPEAPPSEEGPVQGPQS